MGSGEKIAMLGPRESARVITKGSTHVKVNQPAIEKLSKSLLNNLKANKECFHFKGWKIHPLNPKEMNEDAIDWIFLVDALNFSFWCPEGAVKYMVEYSGLKNTGYWSLCAAINRALDEGIPITSAEYCKNFTMQDAEYIFRSDTKMKMPMLAERVEIINEIGKIILEQFDGRFSNCVRRAEGSAQKLLDLVVENFPCFKDEGVFDGQNISFYKRAQILIADLWACFEGEALGRFSDIDTITMFADYRIPQALMFFDALEYSPELMKLLEEDHMFCNGDVMEMEIRAGSIWAVELLVIRINELIKQDQDMNGVHVNAILLDHYLWDYRKTHDAETKHIPYHKIRCIYY